MKNASIDLLPDVLDAKDIAAFLSIGYVKSLKLIRYGGMKYIQIGKVYRVSKANFIEWLHCDKSMIINFD